MDRMNKGVVFGAGCHMDPNCIVKAISNCMCELRAMWVTNMEFQMRRNKCWDCAVASVPLVNPIVVADDSCRQYVSLESGICSSEYTINMTSNSSCKA
jgi:hypothetical protein